MSEEQQEQHAPTQPSHPETSDAERIRQLQARLREAEARQALLTEGVRDFAILSLDPEGRVTWWCEGARRLLGYDEAEVLGRHFSMFFTPEDREAGLPERELRTAEESGSAADENWAVRKGGGRFWAGGFSSARRGDGGALTGFVKIFRDLTERERAHQALRESELRLRAALAAADMGTWLWQVPTDKQTLDENLHRLIGAPEGRSVADLEHFLTFIHEDDRAATREAFLRSAREGCPLLAEFRVPRPGGSVRWLRDKGEAFKDADGRVQYLTGACVDVTERRSGGRLRVEDELREGGARLAAELSAMRSLQEVSTPHGARGHPGRAAGGDRGRRDRHHRGRHGQRPDPRPRHRGAADPGQPGLRPAVPGVLRPRPRRGGRLRRGHGAGREGGDR